MWAVARESAQQRFKSQKRLESPMIKTVRTTLAAMVVIACTAAYARADDKENIKSVAKTFAKAMQDGDTATAKKHVLTDEKSEKFLNVMGELSSSKKKLTDAAVAKFGEEGKAIVSQGPGLANATKMDHNIDDATIEVKRETAVLTSKETPGKPLNLKKDGGEWKVDFRAIASDTQMERGLPIMQKMATAMSETAADIRDGKYQTTQEAQTGLQQKIIATMTPAAGGRP
jgi:hypothetical protein